MPKIFRRHKKLTFVSVLLLITLAVTILFWAYRADFSESTSEKATVEQPTADIGQPIKELSTEEKEKLQKEYEQLKTNVDDMELVPKEQQREIFAYAAFTGARLKDDSAKEYASKALDLFSSVEKEDQKNLEYIKRLELIKSGDFDTFLKDSPYVVPAEENGSNT